jgi:hypothetical protein
LGTSKALDRAFALHFYVWPGYQTPYAMGLAHRHIFAKKYWFSAFSLAGDLVRRIEKNSD